MSDDGINWMSPRTMNPDAAAAKRCPFADRNCVAGNCMAWRWTVAPGAWTPASSLLQKKVGGTGGGEEIESVYRQRRVRDDEIAGRCALVP